MFEKRNNESFSLEVLEWTNCYDWWSSDKQAAEQQIILSFWISLHAHPAIHGYSFIINTNIQVYSENNYCNFDFLYNLAIQRIKQSITTIL